MHRRRLLIGWAVMAALAVLGGGALLALLAAGVESRGGPAGYIVDVAIFTLLQASLSAVLSVGFAVPLALALASRPQFPGRRAMLRLFALPMALPVLVGVIGVLGIYGQAGLLNRLLQWGGAGSLPPVYGLGGILLAHVFYNLPLATLLLLARLEETPPETWRIAASLGLGPRSVLRLIDLPALREVLPRVVSLVFMLAVASFTIVLTLGGGPGATTLEVAIYQALRFDFDPGLAARLAMLQVGLSVAMAVLAGRYAQVVPVEPGMGRGSLRPIATGFWGSAAIGLGGLFVSAPLAAILIDGMTPSLIAVLGEASFFRALATSLVVAALSSIVAVSAAYGLAVAGASQPSRLVDAAALAGLVLPPVVIAAGWFLLAHRLGVASVSAPALVVLLNAMMAVPYAASVLLPAVRAAAERYDRLSASLGISGMRRFWRIDLPLLLRPISLALGLAALVSLGDLGVVAIFGGEGLTTLPLLLYQRLGSYRTEDAAALALLLALLSLALTWLLPRRSPEEAAP
jgi:thiamine transport system permease protein